MGYVIRCVKNQRNFVLYFPSILKLYSRFHILCFFLEIYLFFVVYFWLIDCCLRFFFAENCCLVILIKLYPMYMYWRMSQFMNFIFVSFYRWILKDKMVKVQLLWHMVFPLWKKWKFLWLSNIWFKWRTSSGRLLIHINKSRSIIMQ